MSKHKGQVIKQQLIPVLAPCDACGRGFDTNASLDPERCDDCLDAMTVAQWVDWLREEQKI